MTQEELYDQGWSPLPPPTYGVTKQKPPRGPSEACLCWCTVALGVVALGVVAGSPRLLFLFCPPFPSPTHTRGYFRTRERS